MPPLLDALVAALERPRELPAQVVNQLGSTYGVDRDAIGAFLIDELPRLQDYEIDLTLASMFTPKLADQAEFAELLGVNSIPIEQWPELVHQLAQRPTQAQIRTPDGQTYVVVLREVTLERFVNRLRLDATLPRPLLGLLDGLQSPDDRAMFKAIARRKIWEEPARCEILVGYLTATVEGSPDRLPHAIELLKLVETYQPADTAALLAQIPHWMQILRQEINAGANSKTFFSAGVQDLHGGGRDQRRKDENRITAKQNELLFLTRLHQLLAPGSEKPTNTLAG